MDIRGLKQKVLNYLSKMLVKVQMCWHRYRSKKRRHATLKLQRNFRKFAAMIKYNKLYKALVTIQFYFRYWIGKKRRKWYGKEAYGFDVIEVLIDD